MKVCLKIYSFELQNYLNVESYFLIVVIDILEKQKTNNKLKSIKIVSKYKTSYFLIFSDIYIKIKISILRKKKLMLNSMFLITF